VLVSLFKKKNYSHTNSRCTVHLDRLSHLPEETVRFHMAELSSALCFLHEKHIMHRFALPSLAPSLVHSCPAALTEILSRTISYLMNTAMPISLTLTSPSIIPSVGCSPVWPDLWPIWHPKSSTSADILTPLTGGHLVSVPMSLFLGAGHSGAERTRLSRTAFPKTPCVSPKTRRRDVARQGSTSLRE
jgi:hypothetical protein